MPGGSPSSSFLRKVGDRIRKDQATEADWLTLASFRAAHVPSLCHTLSETRKFLGQIPSGAMLSARIKNVATICEKLARKTSLGRMQDIAGVRVVVENGRPEQNKLSMVIEESGLFSDLNQDDIRASPHSGYRAVHIIGQVLDHSIELQIRTRLQHNWAQMFERLADILGRQIRYGQDPDDGPPLEIDGASVLRRDVVAQAIQLSDSIAEAEAAGTAERLDQAFEEMSAFRQILEALKPKASPSVKPAAMLPAQFPAQPWYLAVYDRMAGRVLGMHALSQHEMENKWQMLEFEHRADRNLEVVLLASASLDELRSTHERYFTPVPGFERGR